MIRAYPRYPTVYVGDNLTLHVATDSPRFRVEFFRQGPSLERVDGSGMLRGIACADGAPDRDWGWPAYEFRVPESWPGGAYIAMLIEVNAGGREEAPDITHADGSSGKALFVVMPKAPTSTVLYKLAWNTYHAYNATGYGSLYAEAIWSDEYPLPGFKVTTRRPGGGTGGVIMPGMGPNYYDQKAQRACFEYWDAPFIRWLESTGRRVDYCTDRDLHLDPNLLTPYGLLLSVGHDEYWSPEMRQHLETHFAKGGNVAFFSGDIMGYRTHFTDADTGLLCAKVASSMWDRRTWQRDEWSNFDPEDRLTGIHTTGGHWDGRRPVAGYTVQHSEHWIYHETGLAEGEVFGAVEERPLIGHEWGATDFHSRNGTLVVTEASGAPPDFAILGSAKPTGGATMASLSAALMGTYTGPRGGIMFTGSVTDWSRTLEVDSTVQQITTNVIDRLSIGSLRIVGPGPTIAGRSVAVEGSNATFHVDLDGGTLEHDFTVEWQALGAPLSKADGLTATVEVPSPPRLVTVTARLRQGTRERGFGSITFLPRSKVEALQVEVLTALREIVFPTEPGAPTIRPTAAPEAMIDMVFPARLPGIKWRAERMARAAAELMAIFAADPDKARDIRDAQVLVDSGGADLRSGSV